jgi:hypothetical protein
MLHERQQVVATKPALVSAADAKARETARIRPPAQRRLADAEETGGFPDIEQIVCVGHASVT